MMKTFLFAMMLLLAPGQLKAQELESRPFSEDHKLWVQVYVRYKHEYLTDGDTVIAGKNCYRLYEIIKEDDVVTEQRYFGAIYDAGKKSYFISPGEESARLLYDFDVSEGEHFYIDSDEMWVEKDSVIQSCGHNYRYLTLHNVTKEGKNWQGDEYPPDYVPGYWIEGVGSGSPYFHYPHIWLWTFWFRLVECYVDGELIYRNPWYHPETDAIEPEALSPYRKNMSVYDLQGRRVGQGNKMTEYHGNKLPKGIYIQNGRKFVVK